MLPVCPMSAQKPIAIEEGVMKIGTNILDIDLMELLCTWAELIECLHHNHSYGGDTAEIYAHRFQKYRPSIHTYNINMDQVHRACKKGAGALADIVLLFCETYACDATIDGLPPGEWHLQHGEAFDHRAYVRVIYPDRTTEGLLTKVERLRDENEQLWIKYRNAQATAERLQAVVDAADELAYRVLHRLPAVAPEDTVVVIGAADNYRELRGPLD